MDHPRRPAARLQLGLEPLRDRHQREAPKPLATVSGRILGLEPDELARVKVTAERAHPLGPSTRAVVDPRGSYRFEALTRDEWWIRAEAGDRKLFESVHIPESEDRIARDLTFLPVGRVYGRVETAGDETIAGATVRLFHRPNPFEVQQPVAETRAGSDGEYSIRLPLGDYEIKAEKEGFVPSPEAPEGYAGLWSPGDEDYVSLQLQPAVELRGRLAGLPPDEADVEIRATSLDARGFRITRSGKMTAQDRYTIAGLGPGTWEVEATCSPCGDEDFKAAGRVVIPEEATEARLDLALR